MSIKLLHRHFISTFHNNGFYRKVLYTTSQWGYDDVGPTYVLPLQRRHGKDNF